jgi:hypothetical protein
MCGDGLALPAVIEGSPLPIGLLISELAALGLGLLSVMGSPSRLRRSYFSGGKSTKFRASLLDLDAA